MVQHKHFKSRVRERMARTGESYTTARRHLLITRPAADPTPGLMPGHPAGPVVATQYDAALWQRTLLQWDATNPMTGRPFTEAMLAGLGGGIGFMVATFTYESVTTASVVLRAHPEPYTERLLERCGVPVEQLSTSSAKRAATFLDEGLDANQTVVVRATHGSLPWISSDAIEFMDSIDVAVVGRVPDVATPTYLVDGGGTAPEEDGLHRASADDLATARAARRADKHWAVRPAPGAGATAAHLAAAVRASVTETTGRMLGTLPLEGIPASWAGKFGVAGMRTWASLLRDNRTVKGWPALFSEEERLRAGLGMVQELLAGSRWGGSGGLRDLYADFLTEASALPGLSRLADGAPLYRDLAPRWDALADAVDPECSPSGRVRHFGDLADHLDGLAIAEEQAATELREALD